MSHEATNWAIRQRGLRPAAKLVLWHLADRHTPDHGCFPNQLRLASDCEMSRSALNSNLDELERRGLIRRIRRLHPQTKRQMSTRYILGFERDFIPEPCPETGHGIPGEPCPDSAQSRVRNPDSNSVKETTTTPPAAGSDSEFVDSGEDDHPPFHDPAGACLEACGPGLSDESRRVIMATSDVVLGWIDAGFDMDLDVLPVLRAKTGDPVDRVIRTWDYFTQAIREAHRRRTRVRRPPATRKAGARPPAASSAGTAAAGGGAAWSDRADYLAWLAGQINGAGYVSPSMVSNTTRDELLARGLVTEERLRARQIY